MQLKKILILFIAIGMTVTFIGVGVRFMHYPLGAEIYYSGIVISLTCLSGFIYKLIFDKRP